MAERRLVAGRATVGLVFADQTDADHREQEREKAPAEERDERSRRDLTIERRTHAETSAHRQDAAEHPHAAEVCCAQANVNHLAEQVQPGQRGGTFSE